MKHSVYMQGAVCSLPSLSCTQDRPYSEVVEALAAYLQMLCSGTCSYLKGICIL